MPATLCHSLSSQTLTSAGLKSVIATGNSPTSSTRTGSEPVLDGHLESCSCVACQTHRAFHNLLRDGDSAQRTMKGQRHKPEWASPLDTQAEPSDAVTYGCPDQVRAQPKVGRPPLCRTAQSLPQGRSDWNSDVDTPSGRDPRPKTASSREVAPNRVVSEAAQVARGQPPAGLKATPSQGARQRPDWDSTVAMPLSQPVARDAHINAVQPGPGTQDTKTHARRVPSPCSNKAAYEMQAAESRGPGLCLSSDLGCMLPGDQTQRLTPTPEADDYPRCQLSFDRSLPSSSTGQIGFDKSLPSVSVLQAIVFSEDSRAPEGPFEEIDTSQSLAGAEVLRSALRPEPPEQSADHFGASCDAAFHTTQTSLKGFAHDHPVADMELEAMVTDEDPLDGTGVDEAEGSMDGDLQQDRVPCPLCNRTFNPQALQRHTAICERVFLKKRRQFDAAAKRLAGVDGELPRGTRARVKCSIPSKGPTAPQNKWRQKSDAFRDAMRAARQAQAHIKAGRPLSELPPPPPTDPELDDRIECPHCGRRFSEAAATRHIPHCMRSKATRK